MTSRDDILQKIRTHAVAPAEAPSLARGWITYADRPAQFAAALASVGGKCVRVRSLADVQQALDAIAEYRDANKRVSKVVGVGRNDVDLESLSEPHQLEDIDFALLPAKFGVCENGAVWVTEQALRHRAVYFLVQHLGLVIPTASLVDNMHQAYERLSFSQAGFGTFISGPSKTADIEQSLVIGAHGPRSLHLFLVDEWEPSPGI